MLVETTIIYEASIRSLWLRTLYYATNCADNPPTPTYNEGSSLWRLWVDELNTSPFTQNVFGRYRKISDLGAHQKIK